jgi:hypothetical protein
MKDDTPEISLRITEKGIERIFIGTGSPEQTAAAWTCLANVSPEIHALDTAIRRTQQSKLLS